MKNLNKFTKSELINKFKKLQENSNNKSLFSKILGNILLFKTFILKITLIALLIKVFKKYSIIRKI
jgi:hypothetical protein